MGVRMMEGQENVPLEIYQKEMREMQREVNYLRKRVATLNDIIVDLQNHTTSSMDYLQDAIDDMQMDLDLR
jgi:predicted  nucleic acid-binding Zn-ribbon protein